MAKYANKICIFSNWVRTDPSKIPIFSWIKTIPSKSKSAYKKPN